MRQKESKWSREPGKESSERVVFKKKNFKKVVKRREKLGLMV